MSLAFDKVRFLLLLFYSFIALLTVVYYLLYKKAYKDSFNTVSIVFFLIYLFWFCLSVYYNNTLIYIFQDSVGFLFYLAYPLLAFILIRFGSETFYNSLISYIGLAVSALHVFMYGLFYSVMGTGYLTYDNLILFNSMLLNSGFTGRLGASGGLLRIDLGLGQLLLIPFAISVTNIIKAKKISACKSQLSFVLIIILGAILDGHRSLLITMVFALVLQLIFSIKFRQLNFRKFIKFVFTMVLAITLLISIFSITGIYDLSMFYGRISTIFVFDQGDISNEARFGQIPALLKKIAERPLIGSGFGSYAEVLRNDERPFMYEVDYLAIVMKLGIIGTVLYIGAYVAVLMKGYKLLRHNFDRAAPYVSAGAAYLFYMGTNGGFAMSLFSTLLHVMIMLGITNSYKVRTASLIHSNQLVHN
ncbi:MAG: O-antigen ligase family protein [Desulfuromonadaceae bacterium]